MYTEQQAFNIAYIGVRDQGGRATRPGPTWREGSPQCRYRAPGGLKCAVGHLIPDDEYTDALEDFGLTQVSLRVPALAGLNVESFLKPLQSCHDCGSHDAPEHDDPVTHESALAAMRRFAAFRGLSVPA